MQARQGLPASLGLGCPNRAHRGDYAVDTEIASADIGTEQERNILVIAYVLHALALVTGLTAIAGVIVNHIKINETQSPFIRSHHSWLIRTFWWVCCGA